MSSFFVIVISVLLFGGSAKPPLSGLQNREPLWNIPLSLRLFEQMRNLNEDSDIRVKDMLYYRFMFEESPHYELGYLFGEVMERYKKMITNAKRNMLHKSDPYVAILKRVEYFQLWFIEIYHLVNMMHEIYPKYKPNPEFKTLRVASGKEQQKLWTKQSQLELQRRKEARDREKRKRRLEQLQEIMSHGRVYGRKPGARPEPYNNWWPLDYGWEPEHWDDPFED